MLDTELFHPAPSGLPIAIRPPRGSKATLDALLRCDWSSFGKERNGDLLQAGALWLHGFLDESHAISQRIESREGSYWHAMMHRSEGDYSNSKYWYRRVGPHPIFADLLARSCQLATNPRSKGPILLKSTDWDPIEFVDAMEVAAKHGTDGTGLLQAIAREEYHLLMAYCLASSERTGSIG